MSLESRLIAEEPTSEDIGKALLGEVTHANGIYLDETGRYKRKEAKTYLLEGQAAMEFLGLPPRKYDVLHMFDHRRIAKKFKALTDEYIKTGRHPSELFWRTLMIRVWKNDNIGQFTHGSRHAEPAEYAGDVFDGRALEGFLPNEAKSNRYNEFRVQLLSVNVTEDMHNASH